MALAEPATVASTPQKLLTQASRLDAVIAQGSALAAQQAARPDVRRFARAMAASHGGGEREMARIAARGGVEGPGYTARASRPAAFAGSDVDAAVVEFEIRTHVDLINVFATYATQGSIPQLRHLAKRRFEAEQAHYRQALLLRERIRGLGSYVLTSR